MPDWLNKMEMVCGFSAYISELEGSISADVTFTIKEGIAIVGDVDVFPDLRFGANGSVFCREECRNHFKLNESLHNKEILEIFVERLESGQLIYDSGVVKISNK